MTLVGYFNSLRDLGGMRRLVDDDVSTRLTRARTRGLANRYVVRQAELTSRMSSEDIRPLLDRLSVTFPAEQADRTPPLDVLLATNMIAVGVDVSRLGVMVVANQPKSTAEYIQATSRVGRQFPGIVFTVYNWARPRDLSAYEHFEYFHANAYRQVEALSVTPFADRAIDRGLFGVLAALVRHSETTYNGNLTAQNFDRSSRLSDHIARHLHRRARGISSDRDAWVRLDGELENRLAYWDRQRARSAQKLGYTKPKNSPDVSGLLRRPDGGRWGPTTCLTSLRDVEPAIPLLMPPTGQPGVADEGPAWAPYQPSVEEDEQ
jgi:hypothetical protein